jgi:ribosomal protein L32
MEWCRQETNRSSCIAVQMNRNTEAGVKVLKSPKIRHNVCMSCGKFKKVQVIPGKVQARLVRISAAGARTISH